MKKSFIFKQDQLEYIIKIKSRRWLWWLLLLLLPLILLIRFERDVNIKAIDFADKKPVPNAEVTMVYYVNYIYDKGRFFTNDIIYRKQATDLNGIARFDKLKYSVYSWLFKRKSQAIIYAFNNCYETDSVRQNYHDIKNNDTIIVQLSASKLYIDFKVVDKDDGEPLPNAKVRLLASVSGSIIDEAIETGIDGKVMFKSVPKCGTIDKVIASAYGYYSDSFAHIAVQDLLSGSIDEKRKLKLRPIRRPIVFYTKDCKTGKGLSGVNASIQFTYDINKKPEKISVITNINGVGKGIYDSAKLIAKLQISGRKNFYRPGKLEGIHKVSDFIDSIKYNRAKRTFCLDPDPNPLVFRNIDSLTRKPLENVKNIIYIANNAGKIEIDTVFSGLNGEFTVSANIEDKISIVSTYPPGYKDNNFTIVDAEVKNLLKADIEKRTIPLSPVLINLVFRTIEDGNNSILVADADLVITGDELVNPVPFKSGNGEFVVKAALLSTISIHASKPGYGSNNIKIDNKSVQDLMKSSQNARDIPLKKEPPPKPVEPELPCNTRGEKSKRNNSNPIFEKEYHMGASNDFYIKFNFYNQADELWIYCGQKDNKLFEKEHIEIAVGKGIEIPIHMKDCNSEYITIIIKSPDGSEWDYSFHCE